ncbi:MAG: hypothetical protein ACLTTO_06310 [Lachnospiraceae bacterium]
MKNADPFASLQPAITVATIRKHPQQIAVKRFWKFLEQEGMIS